MTEYQLHTQGAGHGLAPAYDGRDPMRNRPLLNGTDTSMTITRYGLGREAISDRDQRGVTLPGITRQVDGEYVRHDDHIAIISELQAEKAGLEIMVAAQADAIKDGRRLLAACEAHNKIQISLRISAEGQLTEAQATIKAMKSRNKK